MLIPALGLLHRVLNLRILGILHPTHSQLYILTLLLLLLLLLLTNNHHVGQADHPQPQSPHPQQYFLLTRTSSTVFSAHGHMRVATLKLLTCRYFTLALYIHTTLMPLSLKFPKKWKTFSTHRALFHMYCGYASKCTMCAVVWGVCGTLRLIKGHIGERLSL